MAVNRTMILATGGMIQTTPTDINVSNAASEGNHRLVLCDAPAHTYLPFAPRTRLCIIPRSGQRPIRIRCILLVYQKYIYAEYTYILTNLDLSLSTSICDLTATGHGSSQTEA